MSRNTALMCKTKYLSSCSNKSLVVYQITFKFWRLDWLLRLSLRDFILILNYVFMCICVGLLWTWLHLFMGPEEGIRHRELALSPLVTLPAMGPGKWTLSSAKACVGSSFQLLKIFFQEFLNHFYLLNFKMFTETFFLISVSSSRFPPFISPPLGKQKGVDGNPWTLKLYCSRRVEETVALKFKCLVWMAPIFLRDRADVRYEQATFI